MSDYLFLPEEGGPEERLQQEVAEAHAPFMAYLTYELMRARGGEGLEERTAFLSSLGPFNYFDGFFISYLLLLLRLQQAEPEVSLHSHAALHLVPLLTGNPAVDRFLVTLMAHSQDTMEEGVELILDQLKKLVITEVAQDSAVPLLLLATIILQLASAVAATEGSTVDALLHQLALTVQNGSWLF